MTPKFFETQLWSMLIWVLQCFLTWIDVIARFCPVFSVCHPEKMKLMWKPTKSWTNEKVKYIIKH